MFKIIIDANVWIKYTIVRDVAPLLSRFIQYNLLPITNNYLLSEVFNAIIKNQWMDEKQASRLVTFIKKITYSATEKAVYAISPVPKDNYLFNLAVQNNCVFIISEDS